MIRVSDEFQPAARAAKRYEVVFHQAVSVLTDTRLLRLGADNANNSQPYARILVGDDSEKRSRFGRIRKS